MRYQFLAKFFPRCRWYVDRQEEATSMHLNRSLMVPSHITLHSMKPHQSFQRSSRFAATNAVARPATGAAVKAADRIESNQSETSLTQLVSVQINGANNRPEVTIVEVQDENAPSHSCTSSDSDLSHNKQRSRFEESL